MTDRRSVWVLGAGGIGTGVADVLQEDADVVRVDVREQGGGADSETVDLASEAAPDRLRSIASRRGVPDLAVICAGWVSPLRVEEASMDAVDSIMRANFGIVVNSMRALHVLGQPMTIVVIVSNAAFVARPNQPIYAAAKAATVNLIQTLAVAWADDGIRVVGVAPGTVLVERNRDRVLGQYPDAPSASDRPGGRLLTPPDVGRFVKNVAGLADHLTGRTIPLDAGSTLPR